MENLQLVKIVEENGLEKTQGQVILDNFSEFFKEVSEWENKAKQIKVTSISQIKEMKEARVARLSLKEIRGKAEKSRVKLKEKSRREGLAIDGVANVLKALIIPIEEYLETQEKYAENIEKERKAKVEAQRSFELQKYVEDISLYNFKEMTDDVFNNLLGTLKLAYEARQHAIKQIEIDRIKVEKEKEEEQKRIRIENEKLRKEAVIRENIIKKEKEEQEKKLNEEREKLRKEAVIRVRLEKEIQDRKDKEERDRKEAEMKLQSERLAKLEAEQKAALAPDKEKLMKYAIALGCLEVPILQTKETKAILARSLKLLGQVIAILKNN